MRVLFTFLILSFCATIGNSQILEPVKWSFDTKSLGNDEFELIYTATLDDGWFIYSQYLASDEGPIATSFNYEGNTGNYKLLGKNEERSNHKKSGYDKLFEMDVTKYSKKVDFVQRIKVLDNSKPVSGYLEFMTCDDTRCLPPTEVDFSFSPKKAAPTNKADTKPTPPPTKKKPAKEPQKAPEKVAQAPTTPAPTTPTEPEEEVEEEPTNKVLEPVKWTMNVNKTGDQQYEVLWNATIDKGWYVYSQNIEGDDGPVPTAIYFDENAAVNQNGKTAENSDYKVSGFDKIFEMDITKYKKEMQLSQVFGVTDVSKPLTGFMEYMTCDDTRCLPPQEVPFVVDFDKMQTVMGAEADALTEAILAGATTGTDAPIPPATGNVIDQQIPSLQATYQNPLGDCGVEENTKGKGLLMTFIFGFLGGLVALLTPCVFPMIPLTVSYFTKSSTNKATGIRNALIYGLSIIVIYVTIGLLITGIFGESALNQLSTNAVANVLFFLIFIFFAFSFFGYYEITLPSSWANKSDSMADKGGLLGIFFMAFTLALVSFSCTGPIIGTALVESADNIGGPLVVMVGFSSALALPFALFAAFPGWLNSLPRSGGWMTSVKVILGFLELALAFKFLSVADMTMGWGILPYEVFMGIWVLIFAAMVAYLMGWIRFPHDSPKVNFSATRLFFIGLFAITTIYLATGFKYNEKTKAYDSKALMSGLAPPAHYNLFLPELKADDAIKAKYPSFTKCANNLDCFKDYYEGVAYAKEQNMPILLDFTGHGCVNCRKTEEHIWVEDKVWNTISQDFVLISLYVDERKDLPETLVSKTREKKLRNVGHKWTDFQVVNFQQNSQPLYVMVSPDEKVLAAPRGYQEGVDSYYDFLECGLKVYEASGDGKLGVK